MGVREWACGKFGSVDTSKVLWWGRGLGSKVQMWLGSNDAGLGLRSRHVHSMGDLLAVPALGDEENLDPCLETVTELMLRAHATRRHVTRTIPTLEKAISDA